MDRTVLETVDGRISLLPDDMTFLKAHLTSLVDGAVVRSSSAGFLVNQKYGDTYSEITLYDPAEPAMLDKFSEWVVAPYIRLLERTNGLSFYGIEMFRVPVAGRVLGLSLAHANESWRYAYGLSERASAEDTLVGSGNLVPHRQFSLFMSESGRISAFEKNGEAAMEWESLDTMLCEIWCQLKDAERQRQEFLLQGRQEAIKGLFKLE